MYLTFSPATVTAAITLARWWFDTLQEFDGLLEANATDELNEVDSATSLCTTGKAIELPDDHGERQRSKMSVLVCHPFSSFALALFQSWGQGVKAQDVFSLIGSLVGRLVYHWEVSRISTRIPDAPHSTHISPYPYLGKYHNDYIVYPFVANFCLR